ncbi:M48 family metalloprotease [Kribbella sandramycini]|uniref:M48 family metalloprotease n=1 Tax=Kribbella sandramycini TaxID=60450 RepID=A0A7Y4KV17_9ACTN|nr:M48 family metalloprotease [Kribbella sandramycini]MBB6568219.1 Zn-dependent protease with chaperone function [Kribbella sandramycini]NOL39187.1 M48 family metalloprotease [Kribbella sandramycini]
MIGPGEPDNQPGAEEPNTAWGAIPPGQPGPPNVRPQQPWGQVPIPFGQQNDGQAPRQRLPEPSAWTALLSAVPWFFWSLVLVVWVANAVGFPRGWIVVGLWILSAGLIFLPATEDLLARYLFRLRRPTQVEMQRLGPPWQQLLHRAATPEGRFVLWIQESDEVNASPTPGHTVAVTRWALYTLPPQHLEAALAHELSHHLGGRAWLSLINFWYSIPARGGLIVVRAIAGLMRRVPALGCAVVGFLVLAYAGIALVVFTFDHGYIWPFIYLTPFVAPPLLALLSRWQVKEADRKAALLGYGPHLVQALYGWQMQHQDSMGRETSRRAQVMSSTPSLIERVHTIERAGGVPPQTWS